MNNQGTYPAFAGRSKAGKGKLFYGLTGPQFARFKQIRADSAGDLAVHSENMFTFAGIYIQHARTLAKSGYKDEARNWYRFFQNVQIVAVLEKLPCTGDLKKLREDLNFLGLECHPLDVPNFTTDLEAIKNCLTEILSHVEKTPRKTKTVRRIATGRRDRRHTRRE